MHDHTDDPCLTDDCGRPLGPRLSRRSLLAAAGALTAPLALGGLAGAQTAAAAPPAPSQPIARPERGHYLLKGGYLVSVDPSIGNLAHADVEIADGRIVRVGQGLRARGAEEIDASRMIVMPGFVESHYHLWSTLGRNFTADGFEYFPAKSFTVAAYEPEDFYASVMLGLVEAANAGITTVNNWAHNVRSPAHAEAELRAHRDSLLRARYSYGHRDGQPGSQLIDFADIDVKNAAWFGANDRFEGLVHLGVNLRGPSNREVFLQEMAEARARDLPMCVHAGQGPTSPVRAAELERLGYLGRDMLLTHYLPATDEDRAAMQRTGAVVSLSPHSELRLGTAGGFHDQLLRMAGAGVPISLSFDAASLAAIDMFQSMSITWNLGIPWLGTSTAGLPALTLQQVIEMGTINGARALGIEDQVGSITPGKRADVLLVRQDDLNMAPACDVPSAVVRSANAFNVDSVLVDGRFLKRDRQLVAFDAPSVVRAAAASAYAVRQRAGGRLTPPTYASPPVF